MVFCNSCGTKLERGAVFCPKCSAAQTAVTTGIVGATPTPAASAQRSNADKRVLIAAAAALVVGLLTLVVLIAFALHVAHRMRVNQRDGNVRIESPFGSVESTNNPSDIAREVGIDLYLNARMLKSNAANVNVAGMHTVAAEFETDDPADKVADFYKGKLPNANLSEGDHYSIVSTGNNNLVTTKIEPHEGKTLIKVANVGGKGVAGSSND